MTKYEIVVGFEETGRIQFFGYPKGHSDMCGKVLNCIHVIFQAK